MIANVRGNGAFWPDPFDSLANNLFSDTQSANGSPLPGGLAGLNANDLNHIEKPVAGRTGLQKFWDGVKKVGKKAWKHREAIMGAIEGVGSLLAKNRDAQVFSDEISVVKADYERGLERSVKILKKLGGNNNIVILAQLEELLAYELARV